MPFENFSQLLHKFSLVHWSVIFVGADDFVRQLIHKGQDFIVLTSGLDVERRNLARYDFLDDLESGFLLLAFAWSSVLVHGSAFHAVHVDTVIEFRDDSFELSKKEFNKRVGEYILFVSKVVFNVPEPFANPDKVVGSMVVGVAERVEEIVHFFLDSFAGGQFVERE